MSRLKAFTVTLDRFTVSVDEEFFEIPCDVWTSHWLPNDKLWISHKAFWIVCRYGQLAFQPSEHRVFALTIGYHLVKREFYDRNHQKRCLENYLIEHDAFWLKSIPRSHIFQRIHDFCLTTGIFLVTKLIGRETKDHLQRSDNIDQTVQLFNDLLRPLIAKGPDYLGVKRYPFGPLI